MNIIDAQQLTYYHGANLVLDHISFEVREGDKTALIGRNGSGKTTLMRLLAGIEQPSEGRLAIKKDAKVGYLEQIPIDTEDWTVWEVLSYGLRSLKECRSAMAELESRMSDPVTAWNADELERLLRRYAVLQEQFERGGGYEMEAGIDRIASGLDISKSVYDLPFSALSGGEKTRVMLASQLIVKPDLLLLDEPTNHLDLRRTEWLESFLLDYSGTCIIISHDRYFLDRVATRTIELEDGEAFTADGGYTAYMEAKEARLLQQFEQYQEQQKVVKKMKESIRQLEEWGRIGGNEKFFKRAASMRKALERMEQVKRPVLQRKSADFDLNPEDRAGRRVVSFEQVVHAYGDEPVLQGVSGLLEYGEKIVLMGANGGGKTTLFQVLLGELTPAAGSVQWGARVDAGYLAQEEKPENPQETVLEYFRKHAGIGEGEARGKLARFLFYGPAVFKAVGQLSGGEWTRLRLAVLIHRKPNLLLLDEPTNHLDIESREALEDTLQEFTGTVLAISHDRYFVNRIGEKIWELDNGRLTAHLGSYDDFRAKQEQLTVAKAEGTGKTETADPVRQPVRQLSAEDRDRKKASSAASIIEPSAEDRMKRLEKEIAELETRIQRLDEAIEGEAHPENEADFARLQECWKEREALSAKHDSLLVEWLELS